MSTARVSADLVFKQLNNINEGATLKNPEGRDFNKGVTLKDLERVKVFAERYREHKPARRSRFPCCRKRRAEDRRSRK